jgi:hypothetical protein
MSFLDKFHKKTPDNYITSRPFSFSRYHTRKQQSEMIALPYTYTRRRVKDNKPADTTLRIQMLVYHAILGLFASDPFAPATSAFTASFAGRSAKAALGPFGPLASPGGGRFIVG